MFCLMKVRSRPIKAAPASCPISFHEKKSGSVPSHKKKIWFCLISQKKNLVLSHLIKKKLILFHLTKKKSCSVLVLFQIRIRTGQKILVLMI